jgi:IS4 transposase
MNVGDSLQKETISGVRDWLQSSGVDVEAISLICSEPDLASRETAALRVSLSSKKHTDFLVQNGVLALGSQCRVSHYVPKSPR